ncbi:MAG: undecaprenyl-diphosphate phosphatase [Candidatus Omnitrophica bacterium]|nr:undecaprenyl-diphosphate phosphatase [Candidatus Omnitrophota bacterium]
MPIIKYVFLGIIQGLTEFLPVSSSAHLVIFQDWFGIQNNQILLDIVLHLGTLLAVVVFLFKDIRRWLKVKMLLFIALATILTAGIVMLGKDFFESMFVSAQNLSLPLVITGIILLCTKKFGPIQGSSRPDLKLGDAVWFGIVQGLAVIPGISRSGSTISTLLFRKVERETAFKFSFLASVPAILGALLFKIKGFEQLSQVEFGYLASGFLAAFVSGLLALNLLLIVIRKAKLHWFGYYCIALAIILWWVL